MASSCKTVLGMLMKCRSKAETLGPMLVVMMQLVGALVVVVVVAVGGRDPSTMEN